MLRAAIGGTLSGVWSRRSLALVLALAGSGVACRSPRPARPLAPLPHTAYAHYLDGKLAAHREAWPEAVAALEEAARAAPAEPMITVELARAQAHAKRAVAARATLAAARQRWPDHPEVWLESGEQLAGAAPAEAITAYRRAIAIAPVDERAYLGLARLEAAGPAEATLRQLVTRVPGSVEGHYRLAQRAALRGELPAAIAALRQVLERDPDHLDARLDLARALRRTGDMAQAIAQTRSAFDRAGQALDIAEELFYLLSEADDRQGAIDLLTLLDDDRSDVDALAAVARLARGLGLLVEAQAIAARIAVVDADAGAVLTADLALTPGAGGDPATLAQGLLAIAPGSPRFVEARRLAGEALLAAREPGRAVAAVEPARVLAPADVELALLAARARADAGDRAGASAVLASLGAGVPVQLARARLADHVGDRAGALAILEPLLRTHPTSSTANNLAGYLLADTRTRLADAERYLRRARELAPGDPAVLDSWGWLRLRQGRPDEAVRALTQASRFAPAEAEILGHLAAALAEAGDVAQAHRLVAAALALRPGPRLVAMLDALRARLPPVPRAPRPR